MNGSLNPVEIFWLQCRLSRPSVNLPQHALRQVAFIDKEDVLFRNAMSSGYCALIASASSTGLTGVPCGRPVGR